MVKVYTSDVFTIQKAEFDRDQLLLFFLNGHREEYVLIYDGDQLMHVISYEDILYRREVPDQVFPLDEEVFEKARDYFFSFENRRNRAVAVCNPNQEVECILYYVQNYTSSNYPISEYETYLADEHAIDWNLINQYRGMVFEEYEEYTSFIGRVVKRYRPDMKVVYKDAKAELFLESSGISYVVDSEYEEIAEDYMHVDSKLEKKYLKDCTAQNDYCSLDIMTSMFWRQELHLGDENAECPVMLIRYPLYASGLADMMRFCMTKLSANDEWNWGYTPVIDLSVENDNNQFVGNSGRNAWECFFAPVSHVTPASAKNSAQVLLMGDKLDGFNPYIVQQYRDDQRMRLACRKYLHLNERMRTIVDRERSRILPERARVLGVVARGTDYRYGGFDLPQPAEDAAFIARVRQCMEQWEMDYLLLATEDEEIFEKFCAAGFGERLCYVEQERYCYADKAKAGLLVANMKGEGHTYEDEIPYLTVLYLLAECDALIANCRCGAYEIADYINGDRYEHRLCWREEEVMK